MDDVVGDLADSLQKQIFLLSDFVNSGGAYEFCSKAGLGVLLFLEQARKARMVEISNHLKISKSNATALVNSLYAKELVVRTRSPADRRIVVVSLTAKGNEAVAYYRQILRKYVENCFLPNLSAGEIQQFIDISAKLKPRFSEFSSD